MSNPRLLVPMHLSAMVVNQAAGLATPFFRFQPDYSNLAKFEPVEPAAFDPTLPGPTVGVHLHWLLPRALRHAPDATQGAASFPLVPNRWAVVRVSLANQTATGWVIASDAPNGTSNYVQSSASGPVQVQIGAAYELSSSPTLPTTTPTLTAVAPGSATFAIYAPAVENVFAFSDALDGIAADTFTYHVAGWYSDDAADPLAAVKWSALTDPGMRGAWVDDTFGFTVWSGDDAPSTATMLVHAMLPGVSWDPNGANSLAQTYPSNVQSTVSLAVGNTAIDALAAILALRGGEPLEGDLLEAFQYGLLDSFDQPASGARLDRAIRRHWFGSTPGGTLWTVIPTQAQDSTGLPTPPAPLTTAQAGALDTLNADQAELDRQTRILDSMRWNLAGLWWKYMWLTAPAPFHNPPVSDKSWYETQLAVQLGVQAATGPGTVTPYIEQVEAQATTISTLSAMVAADEAVLDTLLDAATQVRKAANLPQFHVANDPVVLLTGLGRAYVLDPIESLTARLVSQTINQLSGQNPSIPPLSDPANLLPPEVQALHLEAVLLSQPSPGQFPAPGVGVRFPPPPEAMQPWTQPWVPLLMDWRVSVLNLPAYSGSGTSAPVWAFDQSNWSFDGTDYQWAGSTSPADFDANAAGVLSLTGRTFLTPQLPNTLAAQLDQYVAAHSERDPELGSLLADLDVNLDQVSQQDIVSQQLSGLRQQLVQRDLRAVPAPLDGSRVANALGGALPRGFPSPDPNEDQLPVFDFAPIAGTFFTLEQVMVTDYQGQAVDVTWANRNPVLQKANADPAIGLYPIAAPGLSTPMSANPPPPENLPANTTSVRMLALPPRLAQESQLNFRLTSADGANVDVGYSAQSTPICGWVVPNHLDRSLSVYGPDGTALGELSESSQPPSGYVPQWTADPTNPGAPASVELIDNAYVRGFLTALCNRQDDGAGLSDLLLTIDETLWTIEPGSVRSDQDLAVLIGRPLAIVRAELSLRLRGLAMTSQDWWNTFVPGDNTPATQPVPLGSIDGGIAGYLWPLRLGDGGLRDDGLIGYFVDDPAGVTTWSAFAAVQRPAAASGSGYVKQAGSDVAYPQLRYIDDGVSTPQPSEQEVLRITMLVDPRAKVHAFTGLLPVTSVSIPAQYTQPALATMSLLFRAGPILTPVDELRIPRPAERHGTWSWFDRALGATVPIAPADQNASLPATPPRAVEGWLKFVPNTPLDEEAI